MQQHVIVGRFLEIIDVALNTEKKCKSSWLTETKLLFQNSTITAKDILNLCTLKQEEQEKASKVSIWDLFTGVVLKVHQRPCKMAIIFHGRNQMSSQYK
jgi:hypothetical protein